ncbi:hypothetical protein G7Z17_g899 [Cylindrodendrum hubeiense]|uniref:Cyclohexanone monooxygenase n=1 Tax=Cylindrodendrum hubeiense TaxID=595255 RepID=A0A9P5LLT8_9HYPO|nr:hypothetical protein G7Z17_g899 [Cylindrodendrum hubeiense]
MGDIANQTNGNFDEFTIKDAPVENQRPLKVVIIGAGFSGIHSTIRITQRLRNIDLTVYETNEEISGVCYQFSFAPNPYWSSLYAPGPEIRAYMQEVAERFGATRYIKTSHKVTSAIWDAEKKLW